MSAFTFELSFKFAQLRDVLSAEDSTVVPKKDHNSRSAFPQGAKARRLAIGVRERDSGKLAAERFSHAGHSLARMAGCQAAFLKIAEVFKGNDSHAKDFKFQIQNFGSSIFIFVILFGYA
jgi:hypothetical protein